MHAKDFDSALVKRNRALTQLIEDANQFLHDNPPGAISPPVTRNKYFYPWVNSLPPGAIPPGTRQNTVPSRPCLLRC